MLTAYVDTETTGLPDPHLLPEHPAQPHVVQGAVVLVDELWVERAAFCALVRPSAGYEYTIPPAATQVHGITDAHAKEFGLHVHGVMAVVHNMLRMAGRVAAFNLAFDERCLNAAAARCQGALRVAWPPLRTCVMEMAEPALRLPPTARMRAEGIEARYKRPSLDECHRHFFRRPHAGAHDALADARACAAVHRRLLEGARRDGWWKGVLR